MSRDRGGYELLLDLGWAGIGTMHVARRTGPAGFSKRVTVEVLGGALAAERGALQRTLAEVGRAAEINHPNVVQVLEVGEADDGAFVVQEFVDGCPLDRLLDALRRAGKRMPAALAARVVADACEGLSAASALGIVHGDLGPDRLLLGFATGQVKVCGFGGASARPVVPRQGTPDARLGCAAPESFEGAAADAAADVFALGAILYRASLGRAPFPGQTDAAVLHAILKGQPNAPTRLDPAYPPALERVVLRALAVDPSARQASAAEFNDELQGFLETTRASHASVRGMLHNVFPPTDPQRARLAALQGPVGPEPPRAAEASAARPRRMTEPMVSAPPMPKSTPAAAPPAKPVVPAVTVTPPQRKPPALAGQVDLWAELDRLDREFPSGDS